MGSPNHLRRLPDDLHVAAKLLRESDQPVERAICEATANQRRHLRLIDVQQRRRRHLRQAPLGDQNRAGWMPSLTTRRVFDEMSITDLSSEAPLRLRLPARHRLARAAL